MVREVELTQGQVALVDDEDYEWLSQWKWYVIKKTVKGKFYGFYAARTVRFLKSNGKLVKRTIFMHREILETPDGFLTDHIDHNGLNNQRVNLRIALPFQNQGNRLGNRLSKSQYKGVSWHKEKHKWQSKIKTKVKIKHLGYFESEIDAALAYDKAAKEVFGEFAYLNFSMVEGVGIPA